MYQQSSSYRWGTMNPVTASNEPIKVDPFSIVPVDTRDSPVIVEAPSAPFGVSDLYGNFSVNPCTVVAPSGFVIFDPSGTFGSPYGTSALLETGSFKWRIVEINGSKMFIPDP